MQINAVADASVLVSALLFPQSGLGRVLQLAHQGKFALHLSPLLLDETRYALLSTRLRDSYGHTADAVLARCADLEKVASLSGSSARHRLRLSGSQRRLRQLPPLLL